MSTMSTQTLPAIQSIEVEPGHDGNLHLLRLLMADGNVIQIGRGWSPDSARVDVWEPTDLCCGPRDHSSISSMLRSQVGSRGCWWGLMSSCRDGDLRSVHVSRAIDYLLSVLPVLGLVGAFDTFDGEWSGTQHEVQAALMIAFLSE